MYFFILVDWYIAGFSLFAQAALECIIVGWIYGSDRFSRDIEIMIGRKPFGFFIIAWKYITPALIMVLLAITLSVYKVPVYYGYQYTSTATAFGWVIATGPFFVAMVMAVWKLISLKGSLLQRIKKACIPAPDWQPSYAGVKDATLDSLTGDLAQDV